MALDIPFLNGAEQPGRRSRETAGPYRALAVLNYVVDILPRQLRIDSEFFAIPTGDPFSRADPERAIACHQQARDALVGKLLAGARLPRHRAHAIEAI